MDCAVVDRVDREADDVGVTTCVVVVVVAIGRISKTFPSSLTIGFDFLEDVVTEDVESTLWTAIVDREADEDCP